MIVAEGWVLAMKSLIYVFIFIGAILMVTNIIRYIRFIHSTHDVVSSGSKRDRFW